jgi:hypothetical protein
MTSATDFKTPWEAQQYRADHGRTAALAVGQQLYARHLHACAAEDMAILGLREIPEPRPQMWPVTGGTDDDRRARIDAWAKRHGTTAGPDEEGGTYRAVLSFGLVKVIAYMIPDRTMDERLAAIYSAARGEAAA